MTALVFEGLRKRYGHVVALDGCGFSVEQGRIVGFLGPNGAGKTTAMRSVFGLIRPDAGTVTWDGRPITRSDLTRFGYMPEERGLYPKMPLKRQLAYLARLHGMPVDRAGVSADTWIERLGLTARANDRVKDLSKGNQQRVQLAAALVHDPDLLVLDEPFSGLDPPGRQQAAAILRDRADNGAAVLFSSHELDFVEGICDDVAIIKAGRIVMAGDLSALKARSTFRRLELELSGSGLAGAEEDLAGRVDGAVSLEGSGARQTLLVPVGTDLREVLAAIPDTVEIRSCTYSAPPLSELFRQALDAEADAPAEVDGLSEASAPAGVDGPSEANAPAEVDGPSEASAPAGVDGPSESAPEGGL